MSWLVDIPEEAANDVDCEPRKAWEAVQMYNRRRMLAKLEGAENLLVPLAGVRPMALMVWEVSATLVQRVMSLEN